MPERILFRCDAGLDTGGGHVMRCLALAQALRSRGAHCSFACHPQSATVVPLLAASGFPLISAEESATGLRWLSEVSIEQDVAVIDHYGLDRQFETGLRRVARSIAVIDDLADRRHDCDLLVDQTFGREPAAYRDLVPPRARILAGSEYALLRPEFAAAREASLRRRRERPEVRRVLVSLGLTDGEDVSGKVVDALLHSPLEVAIDVVLGPAAPGLAALRRRARITPNLRVYVSPPMAELMAAADVAIGAGGTSSWERCCVGLPTILLLLASNQTLIGETLAAQGAAIVIRPDEIADVPQYLMGFTGDILSLQAMGKRAAKICDGAGTERVLQALQVLLPNAAREKVR